MTINNLVDITYLELPTTKNNNDEALSFKISCGINIRHFSQKENVGIPGKIDYYSRWFNLNNIKIA